MASFPHIKEDPPDWAAGAAHEEGWSNSSCASQELIVQTVTVFGLLRINF